MLFADLAISIAGQATKCVAQRTMWSPMHQEIWLDTAPTEIEPVVRRDFQKGRCRKIGRLLWHAKWLFAIDTRMAEPAALRLLGSAPATAAQGQRTKPLAR